MKFEKISGDPPTYTTICDGTSLGEVRKINSEWLSYDLDGKCVGVFPTRRAAGWYLGRRNR